jgi:hypothetical protein
MPACICFEEGGGRGLLKVHTYPSLPERERERERESLNAHAQQMTHNSGSPILLGKKTKGNGKWFGKCTFVQREEGEKQERVERRRVFGTMLLDSVPEAGC